MSRYSLPSLIIGLGLIASAASYALLPGSPTATPTPLLITLPPQSPVATPTPANLGEREYYRGVYDICVHYGLKSGKGIEFVRIACKEYVKALQGKGWYRQRSPGWEWPLPDAPAERSGA